MIEAPDHELRRSVPINHQVSEQHLLMLTAGAVFYDAAGELTRARAALSYYPRDVWHYLPAS
jgi:hypothetical protein